MARPLIFLLHHSAQRLRGPDYRTETASSPHTEVTPHHPEQAFATAELALFASLFFLQVWLAPRTVAWAICKRWEDAFHGWGQ